MKDLVTAKLLYPRENLRAHFHSERLEDILSQPISARAAAKWFVQSGMLPQFNVSRDIIQEDVSNYAPFDGVDQWI